MVTGNPFPLPVILGLDPGIQLSTNQGMSAFVYIMASQRNGTLYVGVTNDLVRRVWEHREGQVDGFTKQHDVKMLVHYEQHDNFESAITREKTLKKWNRKWKLNLIEKDNPNWTDLYDVVCQ